MEIQFPIIKTEQFEVPEGGETAVLQYRFHEGTSGSCILKYQKSGRRGIASALAHYGLEWAKENNMKAKVLCPFVAIYLKRHPEYNEYVVK